MSTDISINIAQKVRAGETGVVTLDIDGDIRGEETKRRIEFILDIARIAGCEVKHDVVRLGRSRYQQFIKLSGKPAAVLVASAGLDMLAVK